MNRKEFDIDDPSPRLDLSALQDPIASLSDGLEVVSDPGWFNNQSDKVQNTLISGVMKNFESVYAISVKMIRRTIEMEAATPTEVDESSFREVLRLAGEKGLMADVEAWFGYRKIRNVTAHTYDHEKAHKVSVGTLSFIGDASALLQALERRNG